MTVANLETKREQRERIMREKRAALNEQARLREEAEQAAKPKDPWAAYADQYDFADTSEGVYELNDLDKIVDAIVDRVSVYDAYRAFFPHEPIEPPKKFDGNMFRCPFPDHTDKVPDAWYKPSENTWVCGPCGEGGDAKTIVALSLGLNTHSKDYPEVKRAMVNRFGPPGGMDALEAQYKPKEPEPVSLRVQTAAPTAPPEQQPYVPPTTTATVTQGKSESEVLLDEAVKRKIRDRQASKLADRWLAGDEFEIPPDEDDLEAQLAQAEPVLPMSIEELHPTGTNTTITASNKTGKTTLMLNLIRSFADGVPFLGNKEVRQLEGNIMLFNYEVPRATMLAEFADASITNKKRVFVEHFKGYSIDILNDAVFEWVVNRVRTREIDVLILDPFANAYYGKEEDNSDVSTFLRRIDELKKETGVRDLFMTVHTGHTEQHRARGATRLGDWPDNKWVLQREKDKAGKEIIGGKRSFGAEGRRVQITDHELEWDGDTKSLSLGSAGSLAVQAVKTSNGTIQEQIEKVLSTAPGSTSQDLIDATGAAKGTVNRLLQNMTATGKLVKVGAGTKSNPAAYYKAGDAPSFQDWRPGE